jgi:HK97 family phage major capsid protein
MTKEEIMQLGFEELDTRAAAIAEETRTADSEHIEALNAELDLIEERRKQLQQEIEARKKAEAAVMSGAGETIAKVQEAKTMDNKEIRNSKAYIDAFAEYIKGNKDAAELRNMLTSENDPGSPHNGTATVPVPEFVYDVVKTAWERDGVTARVRKAYMKGNLKVGFEISGSAATVHPEGSAAVSAEDLVLGIVELVPQSIKKFVQVSDEALDLSGENFLRYIYDELTYRVAKKAADQLIAKIIASPQTSTTTAPQVGLITSTEVTLGLIAQAMSKLSDEAANPVIIMNKATWGEFKKAQADGNFGYDPFEGLPVLFNNSIAAFSAATTGVAYAIVGDLDQGALMNFPNGEDIEIKVDRLSLKKQDLVEILGRKFVALGVVAPDAFVKIVNG